MANLVNKTEFQVNRFKLVDSDRAFHRFETCLNLFYTSDRVYILRYWSTGLDRWNPSLVNPNKYLNLDKIIPLQ